MTPRRDTVLDLEIRQRIASFLEDNPGFHLRGLAEALELPVSTVEYHCHQLVRHDLLVTREDGGFKAFYPAQGMDRRDKDILYIVRQEMPRRICSHLLLHPGDTPKEIRTALAISAPSLSFHLKRMVGAGLLRAEPFGRSKEMYVEDPERVANIFVTYRKSFVDDVVDRFAKAWSGLDRP